MRFRSIIIAAFCLMLPACGPDFHFVPDVFYSATAEIAVDQDEVQLVFPPDAGSASLTFQSSKDWMLSYMNEEAREWCSVPFEEGHDGTYTLRVSVKENEDVDERSATIILTCADVRLTISVTQQRRVVLLLSTDRVSLPHVSSRFSVDVSANVGYAVTISSPWIRMTGTKGMVTTSPLFEVDENQGEEAREGLVLFKREGVDRMDSLVVFQSSREPGFSFRTAQREVTAPVLNGTAKDAWVIWGDGSFDPYEAGLAHRYGESGWHTVWVEGDSLAPLQVLAPEDGMEIDFRGLKKKEDVR